MNSNLLGWIIAAIFVLLMFVGSPILKLVLTILGAIATAAMLGFKTIDTSRLVLNKKMNSGKSIFALS